MKLKNHLLVSLCALGVVFSGNVVNAAPKKVNGKIVGGEDATVGEFPFIVSLQTRGFGHFCGGSLIKKNWVLTAAHCTRGIKIEKIMIGLHDLSQTSNAESITAKRVIVHPKYDPSTSDYDYALVELNTESKYEPISLNQKEISISEGVEIMSTVAGWGTTREGANDLPEILQKVDVPLVSFDSCNKSYTGQITDRMLCAGYTRGGKDSCQGDSGGPLVLNAQDGQPYLIGVVSWGQGCARAGYPGIYSKVNTVAAWVAQTSK